MNVAELFDRLAEFTPVGAPVLSAYVDTRRDDTGKPHFLPVVRKELNERAKTYAAGTPARASFERDAQRVLDYLAGVPNDASAVVVFACADAGLFEPLILGVPIDGHEIVVGDEPHLYPLARLHEEYQRYAVVVTDTNQARIFVVAQGEIEPRDHVQSAKQRRSMAGGWSQARYQRHIDNERIHHVKEVIDALERLVREEDIPHVVLGGDATVIPMIRAQLSKSLAERVVDVLPLDVTTPLHEILRRTLATMREQDAAEDAQQVERMLSAYRSGGLGVIGLDATRAALENGQVHELLIAADAQAVGGEEMADALVARARQTGARVRVIEDPSRMRAAGGVGALLRYRIGGIAA
jgi:ribosomal protein L7Ae-like RNA K-turn-binding protein